MLRRIDFIDPLICITQFKCITLQAGGIHEVLIRAQAGGRIQFSEASLDPTVRHTIWTQTFGGIFVYLSLYGVNQAQVQRLLTIKDLKGAQYALMLQWPILALLSTLTLFAGLVLYVYYEGCDPLLTGRIQSGGQLLPLFVMETMSQYPGVAGIVLLCNLAPNQLNIT